ASLSQALGLTSASPLPTVAGARRRIARLPRGYAVGEHERQQREDGQDCQRGPPPGQSGLLVLLDDRSGGRIGDPGVRKSEAQVRVGDERDTPGQLHLRSRLQLRWYRRVVLDVGQERRGECGDENRPGEGGADRGAQV